MASVPPPPPPPGPAPGLPPPPKWGPGLEELAKQVVAVHSKECTADPHKRSLKRQRQKARKEAMREAGKTESSACASSSAGSTCGDEKTVRFGDWELVSTAAASARSRSASGSHDGSFRACPEAEVVATASDSAGIGKNHACAALAKPDKKGAEEYRKRIQLKKYPAFAVEEGDDQDEATANVMSQTKARRYKYECRTCKEELPASELYLECINDWCGGGGGRRVATSAPFTKTPKASARP